MSSESDKQSGDAPAFSAQDAMAFMQKMWNPFAMPMPGAAPATATAPGQSAPQESAPPHQSGAVPDLMSGMIPGLLPFPNPAAMLAALDPVEVERKIGELRIIEGWLAMSLNFVQMSIRTLELQHASLEALHAGRQPAKPKAERRRG